MDAFFASVEIRDDPRLRTKPVLVGGAGRRGVVAAASYEARAYGCHSAQPMAQALRRCPHAVVIGARHDLYAAVSRQVFDVFDRFSPVVEALSIDEAFLDMTGSERLLGPPRRAAETLRHAVREQTGLTCSVGISSVKFIAKIASGKNKPDGLTEIAAGDELAFVSALPISELWGVGPKTQTRLREHGIRTVGDLRALGRDTLVAWFGEHGAQLHRLSMAEDPRPVEPGRGRKSISHEDTYAVDIAGHDALRSKLLSQSTRVADRLTAKRLAGRRIQLRIRDDTFKTETRQCMLEAPTREARRIYSAACRLLDAVDIDGRRFRLTGVGVGALVSDDDRPARQLDLLDPATNEPSAGDRLQHVLSSVRERYGHQALYPADAGRNARVGTTGAVTRTVDPEEPNRDDAT